MTSPTRPHQPTLDNLTLSRKEGWFAFTDAPALEGPEQLTRKALANLGDDAVAEYNIRRRQWHANLGPVKTPQLAHLHEDLWDIAALSGDGGRVCNPAIVADTIVIDHGRPFKSQHITSVCQRMGISIQPVRLRTGRDKGIIERFFLSLRLDLLQHLPGYKGPDIYSRGVHPESEAFLYIDEIEAIIRTWVATVYHNRPHDSLVDPAVPGHHLSPAEMFQHGVERAGYIEALRGGEQGVRVINDPHRLIERALVLKRLSKAAAHRERDDTDAFTSWLAAQQCPSHWRLPEPLAVIDVGESDAVYVMSRQQGRVLGACIVEPLPKDAPSPEYRFTQALHYLAAYQAWRSEGSPNQGGAGHAERTAFEAQLDKAERKISREASVRKLLAACLDRFVDPGAPVVAKKDPHPGNWLWTPTDNLVLIDLESSVKLPLLQEAITVIDDLPLLDTADPEAWSKRLRMAADYCAALRGFGVEIPDMTDDDLQRRYEALAALHAVKGIGRVRRADIGAPLFSLAIARLQTTHYRGLLGYLADAAGDPNVRDLAALVLTSQLEPRPPHQEADAIAAIAEEAPSQDAAMDGGRRRRRGRRASRPSGPASGDTGVSQGPR